MVTVVRATTLGLMIYFISIKEFHKFEAEFHTRITIQCLLSKALPNLLQLNYWKHI